MKICALKLKLSIFSPVEKTECETFLYASKLAVVVAVVNVAVQAI